jgi:mono/diheme cytochrome c family protein
MAIVGLTLALGASRAVAQGPNGGSLFSQNCAPCHGAKGVPSKGMTQMYSGLKSFGDSAYMATLSADSIGAVIKNGVGKMKGYGSRFSAEQVAAIATFVKSLAP